MLYAPICHPCISKTLTVNSSFSPDSDFLDVTNSKIGVSTHNQLRPRQNRQEEDGASAWRYWRDPEADHMKVILV